MIFEGHMYFPCCPVNQASSWTTQVIQLSWSCCTFPCLAFWFCGYAGIPATQPVGVGYACVWLGLLFLRHFAPVSCERTQIGVFPAPHLTPCISNSDYLHPKLIHHQSHCGLTNISALLTLSVDNRGSSLPDIGHNASSCATHSCSRLHATHQCEWVGLRVPIIGGAESVPSARSVCCFAGFCACWWLSILS